MWSECRGVGSHRDNVLTMGCTQPDVVRGCRAHSLMWSEGVELLYTARCGQRV